MRPGKPSIFPIILLLCVISTITVVAMQAQDEMGPYTNSVVVHLPADAAPPDAESQPDAVHHQRGDEGPGIRPGPAIPRILAVVAEGLKAAFWFCSNTTWTFHPSLAQSSSHSTPTLSSITSIASRMRSSRNFRPTICTPDGRLFTRAIGIFPAGKPM